MAVIRSNLGWKVKDFRGSKEEAERIKRKGINLEQESAKKQKTSKEVPEEAKSPKEVTEEKVKEMMQLVPIEEVSIEALKVKHPIIDWKVELSRLYEPDKEDQLWTHTQNFMHALVEWKLYDTGGVDSGFIADQDRATIAKSSTLPHDFAPRVTSPATDEGSSRGGNC
nr:hypothetical protein [Tanacetum cinerariifolium]